MYLIFTCVQWVWGFPQTILGFIIYLINIKNTHLKYRGACVTLWNRCTSLSLGKFIFLSKGQVDADFSEGFADVKGNINGDSRNFILLHEYGHCIQSLILGPLYLLVIGIPSTLWCNLPLFEKRRRRKNISYYDFLPEKNANCLSEFFKYKRR